MAVDDAVRSDEQRAAGTVSPTQDLIGIVEVAPLRDHGIARLKQRGLKPGSGTFASCQDDPCHSTAKHFVQSDTPMVRADNLRLRQVSPRVRRRHEKASLERRLNVRPAQKPSTAEPPRNPDETERRVGQRSLQP